MIAWLTAYRWPLLIAAALLLFAAGAFTGWRAAGAQESARQLRAQQVRITELETHIAVAAANRTLHAGEVARLEKQHRDDRDYYAALKREVEKFKHFTAAPPPDAAAPCHENPDPVVPADLVRLRNDAKAGLR